MLVSCLIIYLLADALLFAFFLGHANPIVLIACAAALGASTPPSGPLSRAYWKTLVSPEHLTTAFAVTAGVNAASVILGPLLVTATTAVASPFATIAGAGVAMAIGVGLLLGLPAPANHSREEEKPSGAGRLGPLGCGDVRWILLVGAFDVLGYGCLIVGLTAAATSRNTPGTAGLLIGVWSASVLTGGLIFGARDWPGHPRTKLVVLYGAGAAALALAVLYDGLVALLPVIVAGGMLTGPRDVLLQLVLGAASPRQHTTESFAWLNTSMWASYGAGTALGGIIVGQARGQAGPVLLCAAIATGLCALGSSRLSSSLSIQS